MKEHDFERISFMYHMKKSVAALLDIPYHQVDQFKNDPNVYVAIGYKNEPETKFDGQPIKMWSPIREMQFREFLQYYGTEAHRDIFGPDIWLDRALPVGGYYAGRKIVITDVRYKNEIDRIHHLGGIVIRVNRPKVLSDAQKDLHRSEFDATTYPDAVDLQVDNDGTIEELYAKVEEVLSSMFIAAE
jgi:hypothetical protein